MATFTVIVRCEDELDYYDFDSLESAVGCACGFLDRQAGESIESIQEDANQIYSAREILNIYQNLAPEPDNP